MSSTKTWFLVCILFFASKCRLVRLEETYESYWKDVISMDWSYTRLGNGMVRSRWEQKDLAEMIDEKGERLATFVDDLYLNRTMLMDMKIVDKLSRATDHVSDVAEGIRVFLRGGPSLVVQKDRLEALLNESTKKLCKGSIKMIVEEEYLPGYKIPGKRVPGYWIPKQVVPGYDVPSFSYEDKRCYQTQYEEGYWVPREFIRGNKTGEYVFINSTYEVGYVTEGRKVNSSAEMLRNGQTKETMGYHLKAYWNPGYWVAGYYTEPEKVKPYVLKKNYVGGYFYKGYCKPPVEAKGYHVHKDYYRAKYVPGYYVKSTWVPPTYIPRKYLCVLDGKEKVVPDDWNKVVNPKLHGCGSYC